MAALGAATLVVLTIPTAGVVSETAARDAAGIAHSPLLLNTLTCLPPGGQCGNGDPCTSDEHCAGGVCVGGAAAACNDADPCTVDACNPLLGCVHPPAADGTSCDDADRCNGPETCQSGVCTAGDPPVCDDGLVCTTDGCQPAAGCTHAAIAGCCTNEAACDDGDPCTGTETCRLTDHTCQPGTPVACNDGNPCNGVETCRTDSGACDTGTPPSCDDGIACTTDTVVYLRSGSCQTGTQVVCNDDSTGCVTGEPNDHHDSRMQVSVTSGQTYFIVVDGYNGRAGAFSLTVTPP